MPRGRSVTTGCARLARSTTLAGRDSTAAALAGYLGGAAGAVGPRPARGARARLGRLHLFVWDHGRRSSRPGRAAGARRPQQRPAVRAGSVRVADGVPRLRLQGGGRDRRARRQHRAPCAPPIARRRAAAPRAGAARRRGHGARPHPLGQRRHHPRGQRPPAQQRRARAHRRRAVRGRRAQRRRRQPRRPQGARTVCASPARSRPTPR